MGSLDAGTRQVAESISNQSSNMISTNTIETSMPPAALAIGLLASVVLFLWLLRRELRELTPMGRRSITALRILLCILVWWLIAQPRAVTERYEEVSPKIQVGIDASRSMTLADVDGATSARWLEDSKPGLLDEAIALTEAAKIRLNLLSGYLDESQEKLKQEAAETGELLAAAQLKVNSFGKEAGFERLVSRPREDLAAAVQSLKDIDAKEPSTALTRSAKLAADAALSLRRVAVLHSSQNPMTEGGQGTPRIDLVNQWLQASKDLFADLAEEGDLRISTFASDVTDYQTGDEVTIPETGGMETRLYESLNRLAAGDHTNGGKISVLITDGLNSEGLEEVEFSAEVRSQPLIVLQIGDTDTSPDVRIESVVSPAQVREKDNFVAGVRVSAFNSEPCTVAVTLLDSDRILASQDVRLNGDGASQLVELEWQAVGAEQKQMRVEVTALPNEKNTHNNLKELNFTVTKDKYRILVSDAFPRWETRYLQNLFKRDPSIEASSVIFEPRHTYPGKAPVVMPALPLSLEAWQKFDLVVLGDVSSDQLTTEHQKLLIEYVNSGGNLMLLAGKNAMPSAFVGAPLESLLPMTRVQDQDLNGSFVISPPENRALNPMIQISKTNAPSLWRTIYSTMPSYRISAWARAKQSAQSLLVATDNSSGTSYDFLAVQRYGGGRVAFAAAPCFYHLRFRYGDRYHVRFWGNIVRGLCVGNFGFEGGMVRTRLDRQLWDHGNEVQGRVSVEDPEGLPVTEADFSAVLTRDGEIVARMKPATNKDRPGEYFIRFPNPEPGEYFLAYEGGLVGELWEMDRQNQPDPPECRFRVIEGYVAEEMQFPMKEPVFWNKVNGLPLGATIHPQTLPMVLAAIDLKAEKFSIVRSRSIWDTWTILLSIIGIAGLEWLLRRTQGLC